MYNNKKLFLSIFWVILGAVLFGLSFAGKADASIYSGMGGALMAIGALQILKNFKYRSDSEYREKIDTEVEDERNKFLRMKSWSWTGYIIVLGEAAASLVAMFAGAHEIQMILSYSVCLMLLVYWITYMILSRKY